LMTCLQNTASDAGMQSAAHIMYVLDALHSERVVLTYALTLCCNAKLVVLAAISSRPFPHSGQLALSVAEGNPEGAPATGKGELDPWSFPTGQPWARKASSVEPSNAEPLPKKRKLSSSAADNTTLATSSPVERSAAVAAASKLDGSSAYGEAL